MPRLLSPRLVPYAGFAATFLAAAWMSAASGGEARARVHDRSVAYCAAVSQGRVADALAFHVRGDEDAHGIEIERSRLLRGALWLVREVEPLEEGRFAARVVWFRGEQGAQEEQVWEEGPDGIWRLWGWLGGDHRGALGGAGRATGRLATFP